MRLVIFILVAIFAFLSPPFIFYFFIHDSGWEMVLRASSFFYFLGLGLLVQQYKRAADLWVCLLYAFLSIVVLFSFPFIFKNIYHSNWNLNNSSAIESWSTVCNISFLIVQALAVLYFNKGFRREYNNKHQLS